MIIRIHSFLFILVQFVRAPPCTLQISRAILRQKSCAAPLMMTHKHDGAPVVDICLRPTPSHLDFQTFQWRDAPLFSRRLIKTSLRRLRLLSLRATFTFTAQVELVRGQRAAVAYSYPPSALPQQ